MEDEKISFRIVRVKDISFNVNEMFLVREKKKEQIKVSLNCELRTNFENNILIIEIFAFYHYDDSKNQLASITVQNVFNVVNLSNYKFDSRLKIPIGFIVTLVSLSISHTRALLTKNIDGTAFSGSIIPVIDPVEFAKSVFPDIFSGEGLLQEDEVLTAVHKDNHVVKKRKK